MKLLLFSDVHCNHSRCQGLVELAMNEDVDFVIGAGDFANIRRGLEPTIEVLSQISKPTIVVPGNSESDEELQNACQAWPAATVLHGSGATVNGVDFWGIGGGIPVTPFGAWSFDFTEQEAAAMLANCPAGSVLVSHSPPKGAVDVSSGGRSLGSVAIREAILAKQPSLVVCGHIHESAGNHAMIGRTPVVNAGPQGVVWEF